MTVVNKHLGMGWSIFNPLIWEVKITAYTFNIDKGDLHFVFNILEIFVSLFSTMLHFVGPWLDF